MAQTHETDRPPCAADRMEVHDETVAYGYSNIFNVRLRVAVRLPGVPFPYTRVLEKCGVYQEDLERTRQALLEGFRTQTLPYLEHPQFTERFVARLRDQRRASQRLTGYR